MATIGFYRYTLVYLCLYNMEFTDHPWNISIQWTQQNEMWNILLKIKPCFADKCEFVDYESPDYTMNWAVWEIFGPQMGFILFVVQFLIFNSLKVIMLHSNHEETYEKHINKTGTNIYMYNSTLYVAYFCNTKIIHLMLKTFFIWGYSSVTLNRTWEDKLY